MYAMKVINKIEKKYVVNPGQNEDLVYDYDCALACTKIKQ